MSSFEIFERAIVNTWLARINEGLEARHDFDKTGDLLWKLYTNTDGAWLSNLIASHFNVSLDLEQETRFPVRADKVSELIDLYGPMLYNQNPVRTLAPRARFSFAKGGYWIDDQERQRRKLISDLTGRVLNYTPDEYRLKDHSRWAIIEGLIRGRGCMWTEVVSRADGTKSVCSKFDTVKRLVIDPNAENLQSAQWIARLHIEPIWKVKQKFGIPDAYPLKGNLNYNKEPLKDEEYGLSNESMMKKPYTDEMYAYWEVFSKMGLGGRFSDAHEVKQFEQVVRSYVGDYVRLIIPLSQPWRPLNFPYQMQTVPDLAEALRWPIEFWQDNRWPVSVLDLHQTTNSGMPRGGYLWPRSHLQGSLSEILLISFLESRLAHKAWWNTREIIAMAQQLGPEIEDAIKNGGDLTTLKLKTNGMQNIENLVKNIQNPNIPMDLYRVLEFFEGIVERRTGLSELMAGQRQSQMRTRSEAQLVGELIKIRPDDMADIAEDWQSEVARNEYHAARRKLRGMDVKGLVGDEGAQIWDMVVATESVSASAAEFECRIEAGTSRKPDKAQQIDNANSLLRNALPYGLQWAQISLQTLGESDVGMANSILRRYYQSMDVDEPEELLLKPIVAPTVLYQNMQAQVAIRQLQQQLQQAGMLQPQQGTLQQQQQVQQQTQAAGAPAQQQQQAVQQQANQQVQQQQGGGMDTQVQQWVQASQMSDQLRQAGVL